MGINHGVIADPAVEGVLAIREIPVPTPLPNEAVVSVRAFSLNRGEVRMSRNPRPNWRPGWDISGIVTQSAKDGTGPKEGTRVVGLMRFGGWAETICMPTDQMAALPDNVEFEAAATLPVAGLTALHGLMKGGFLLEKQVLITGATGGVGEFAIQLAKLGGARVVASVRRQEQEGQVRELGADHVLVGEDLPEAESYRPYALVIDSVGGKTLGRVLGVLDEHSVVVSIGTSGGNEVMFDASKFYGTGLTRLIGMILFDELKTVETATVGLERLAGLVSQGRLKPRISLLEDWSQVANVAQQLMDRTYPGKAVLRVTNS